MAKTAPADHPIHTLIAERWSPYWFCDRDVSRSDLLAILEATRWAASSYNEQPWIFFLARRRDERAFQRMLSCLVEGNRAWAASAAVLMLGLTRRRRELDGEPNPAAEHDLGLAAATLTLEAMHRGVFVHQMSGIEPDRIRAEYRVPDSHTPLTALALGYPAAPDAVPERFRERHLRERTRRPLAELVYAQAWGRPAQLG